MKTSSIKIVLIILGIAFSSFAHDNNKIQTINVFSGVPQPSDDGPNQTGGFGDVAANLVSSIELKERYPNLKIRLIVTSSNERVLKNVPTANEIVTTMVPSLNHKLKDQVQYYRGIEVIFLGVDFKEVMDEHRFDFWPSLIRDYLSFKHLKTFANKLKNNIPQADLNLNFSHYPEAWPLARINSKLSIGTEEIYGENHTLNFAVKGSPKKGEAHFLELATGPYSLGYLITNPRKTHEEAMETIRSWSLSKDVILPLENFEFSVAYSAIWQSVQIYIDAISQLDPIKERILFVKDYPELDYSRVPSHLKIIPISGVPHEVMSSMIQKASISPLVTGDVSFGQSLSSLRKDKTFIYESPFWKIDAAIGLRKILADELGFKSHQLRGMFLPMGTLLNMTRNDMWERGSLAAKLIGNTELQGRIYKILSNKLPHWDIISNTMKIAESLASQEDPSLFNGKLTGNWKGSTLENHIYKNIGRPLQSCTKKLVGK